MNQVCNKQGIVDVFRQRLLWPEAEGLASRMYTYHIKDSLGRKWHTIGYDATDAVEVFTAGYSQPWTYIVEPASYDSELTHDELVRRLYFGPGDGHFWTDMPIILNTTERRNELVRRIVNVNEDSLSYFLYQLKKEYLLYDALSPVFFCKLYSVNPIEALSLYFLENVDLYSFWQWEQAGGEADKAISYKEMDAQLSFAQALVLLQQKHRGNPL
ncbi:hypothetical protein D3C74_57820 [compost metagenome]